MDTIKVITEEGEVIEVPIPADYSTEECEECDKQNKDAS